MSEPERATSEKQTEDKVQYVRKFTKLSIIVSELISLSLALTGGIFFGILVLLSFPKMDFFSFLALWLVFPILLTIVAVRRNHILEWIFKRISHEGYLQFAFVWKTFPLFIFVISFYLWLNSLRYPTYLLFSLTFLFLFMPLYFIFEHPLSYEGEVQILFEGLFSSLDNFHKRQYYMREISKIIENLLKIGNIQVSSSDLIYHLNKKLLETNEDISNDLRDIQAWMLGRQRTCLDSLKRIVPDIEIKPCTKKGSFLERAWENLTPTQASLIGSLIKFFALLAILLIVLLVRPETINQAINLAKGLLGM